jgi:uncharacterized membrane protein YbhN (UPF0104 family)
MSTKSTPASSSPRWKYLLKRSWPAIRVALSIALLWLATSGIDWEALFASEMQIEPLWFVAAAFCLTGAFLCGGLRWGLLMRSVGFEGSIAGYISLYVAGGLINQGLPSTLGGDSYRAITGSHLKRSGALASSASEEKKLDTELHQEVNLEQADPKLRLGFAMTFVDRLIGLAGNNLLGGIGLILGGATLAAWGNQLGYAVIAVMVTSFLIAAIGLAWGPTRGLLQKILDRFRMGNALPGVRMAFGWPMNVAQALFSIGIHFLNILALGFCLKAYGAEVPIEALMIGLPALSLLLVLPISISGWGLREATLTSVLALWGVSPSLTVLGSISFGAMTVLCFLPGAYVLLRRK